MSAIFTNGRFFVPQKNSASTETPHFANSMLVKRGTIIHIGDSQDVEIQTALTEGSEIHDLGGRIVLPGIVDGHMHLMLHGQSLAKVDLGNCRSLEDIRKALSVYCQANPNVPRILARGWQQYTTGGSALASMIDDIDPRSIFIDSLDAHSTWCNTLALKELGVANMSDPAGGKIHRDSSGLPSGLLSEGATVHIAWPFLAGSMSTADKIATLRGAVKSYSAQGYTGVVEMAMDDNSWDALQLLRVQEHVPLHIAAYWLITPDVDLEACLAQVDKAIEMKKKYNVESSPDCHITGIKIVCDGVVDSCTAALLKPYSNSHGVSPDQLMWATDILSKVLQRANNAGLQIALHAIGDAAIKQAVDSLEKTDSKNKRHRIEHLELASATDAHRLGKLGITASIQPVHSDPAGLRAWPTLLGEHRCGRAFPYTELLAGGATLALGSDSPTASHVPFNNWYSAATRRSATELEYITPEVLNSAVLPLATAVQAATKGAAYSTFSEGRFGELESGLEADFVVVDMAWDADRLLESRVVQTWFGGEKVFGGSV
ncbi:hypothetical protein IFR05_015257 [Cadophora sp. M221]|nr:hypothetical protein IFR05_015257 [Cadophora sp. M221]